jgi:spore maturation protein CgeB
VEKILIIQLTRMGDSVQTLPVLKLLKRQKAESSITLLCVKEVSGIFSRTPFVDRIVTLPAVDVAPMRGQIPFKGLNDYGELLEEYDSVINLTHNWVGGFFCANVKGIFKSGLVNSDCPMGQVKSDRAKYLFASQKSRTENLFNIVDMHSAMAGVSPEPVRSYMQIQENEIDDGYSLLRQHGFEKKGKLIAFQLGANMLHRAWPLDHFAVLAERLAAHSEIEVVLLGAKSEEKLAQDMRSRLTFPAIDLVGRTGISELCGVLKHCSILISNDTGTIHLAAAAGIRTVGIFFSTAYFAETAPYGEGHSVLQAELPCSPCHIDQKCENPICRDAIPVEAVEAVVEKMLGYRKSLTPSSPGFSVYVSDFAPDGPLLYAPAEPAYTSDRFLAGLISRFLWGGLLGFTRGSPDVEHGLLEPYRPESVSVKLKEASEKNSAFINWYSQAARLLAQAAAARAGPGSGTGQLESINGILKTIDAAVLSSEDSIQKYFHMLQMADLNFNACTEPILAMKEVYAGLLSMVESFDGGIERLKAALPRQTLAAETLEPQRKQRPSSNNCMRVLIAGPVAGGSLPVARSVAAAFAGLNYESTFIDFSPFAGEFYKARASENDEDKEVFVDALEKTLIRQIEKSRPDVLLGIAQSPLFNVDLLDSLRKSGVITTFWFVEDFRLLTYWQKTAPFFDIFFSIQKEPFARALAEIGANNHYYLPVAFNSNFDEFPVQTGPRMPISFVGAPYPNRVRAFEKLPFDLKIFGEGWNRHPIHGVIADGRRISETEAGSIYRNTEINLNLHSSMNPEAIGGDFVNPRTFELAGLGCFQLSDRRECLPYHYSENEVVQFENDAQMVHLINHYLKNETERNEIAMNARRKTLRDHLYEHRVMEIMKAVQQL